MGDDYLDDDDENIAFDGIPSIPSGAPMPNQPRNPDDPRELLRQELERKYGNEKTMMSPAMRQADRGARDALMDNNRALGFQQLVSDSAAQMGTIGGKSANNAAFGKFTSGLQDQNNAAYQGMMKDRADMQGAEDRRIKIMEYLADRYGKDQATSANYQLKKRGMDDANRRFETTSEIQRERNRIAADAAKQKTGKTAGTDAVDKDYAKDYNDWRGVGRGQFEKNLKLLEDAEKELETTPDNSDISGNWVGRAPDALRSQESRLIQQKVQEAAQGGLKAALGAQFTEREGQQIMSRAYDPTLPPSMNRGKIRDAINQLKENQRINEAKARYYEDHGTLRGFTDAGPQAVSDKPDSNTRTSDHPKGNFKPIEHMTTEEKQRELDELTRAGF